MRTALPNFVSLCVVIDKMYRIYKINPTFPPVKDSIEIEYFVYDKKGVNCLGACILSSIIYWNRKTEYTNIEKYDFQVPQSNWDKLIEEMFFTVEELGDNPDLRYKKYIGKVRKVDLKYIRHHTDKITDLIYFTKNYIPVIMEVDYFELWGIERNAPDWHAITLVGMDLLSDPPLVSILEPTQTKFRHHNLPMVELSNSWRYENRFHLVMPKHQFRRTQVEFLDAAQQATLESFFRTQK